MQWWRTTTASLHVCSAAFVLGVWSCSLGLIFHEAICLLLHSMCRSSANLKCKNLTSSKFYKRYHHITYKCSRSLCFICCFLKRRYHIFNCSLLFRLCNDMILSWYKKFETNTATRFTSFCVVSTMTSKDIVIFIKLCQASKFVWIMLCCWCDVLLLLLSSLSNLNESHFTFTVHTRTTWWSAVDLERLRLKNNLPSCFGTILFDLQTYYSCQWKLSIQITVSVSGWFLGLLVLYILIILLCRTDGGIAVEDTHQFVDSDDVFERPPFSVLFHIPGAGTTHGLIWAHIYERQLCPDVRYSLFTAAKHLLLFNIEHRSFEHVDDVLSQISDSWRWSPFTWSPTTSSPRWTSLLSCTSASRGSGRPTASSYWATSMPTAATSRSDRLTRYRCAATPSSSGWSLTTLTRQSQTATVLMTGARS